MAAVILKSPTFLLLLALRLITKWGLAARKVSMEVTLGLAAAMWRLRMPVLQEEKHLPALQQGRVERKLMA